MKRSQWSRGKRVLKSGMDQTAAATSISKRITWPHEVIYGADGHPATTYKDLTVSSSFRGYIIVLKEVQISDSNDCMVPHLEDLMEDMDIYC